MTKVSPKMVRNADAIAKVFAKNYPEPDQAQVYDSYAADHIYLNVMQREYLKHRDERVVLELDVLKLGAVAYGAFLKSGRLEPSETFGDFVISSFAIISDNQQFSDF